MGFISPCLADFDLDEWRAGPRHRRLEDGTVRVADLVGRQPWLSADDVTVPGRVRFRTEPSTAAVARVPAALNRVFPSTPVATAPPRPRPKPGPGRPRPAARPAGIA